MPKGKMIGKMRSYTLERLQELRRQADRDGDIESRDKLAARIIEQGGELPTSEIPEDETEIDKLVRLRREAAETGDTATCDALTLLVSEYEKESERSRLLRQLSEAIKKERVDSIQALTQQLTEVEIADYERYLEQARREGNELGVEVFGDEIARLKRDGYQCGEGDYSSREGIALKEGLDKQLPLKQIRELLEAYKHRHDLPEPESESDEEMLTRMVTEKRKTNRDAERKAAEDEDPFPFTIPPEPQDAPEVGDHCSRTVDGGLNDPEPGSAEWMKKYPHIACEETEGNCDRPRSDPLCEGCRNGDNYVKSPQDAPSEPTEAPEAHLPHEGRTLLNNGTASISAKAMIELEGWNLAEIPAKDGGKVTVHDTRRYKTLLAGV